MAASGGAGERGSVVLQTRARACSSKSCSMSFSSAARDSAVSVRSFWGKRGGGAGKCQDGAFWDTTQAKDDCGAARLQPALETLRESARKAAQEKPIDNVATGTRG